MQANGPGGGTTSTETPATATSVAAEDQPPEMSSGGSQVNNSSGTHVNQVPPPSQNQQQQQQQRNPSSPSQQMHQCNPPSQQKQPILAGSMTGPGNVAQVESNVHQHTSQQHQHHGGNYRHRHGQSYQSQHIQHYNQQQHHHHQLQPNKQYQNMKGDNESNINHVLLITVINPHYPITCDLIHQICSGYGKVNRIVIFKKNGVQAMVEFDNIDSAKRARSMLYGCDIYSGCCTLRLEYAKPTRLNVHKNDSESFDYTNLNLGNGGESETGSAHNDQSQHHHHQVQAVSHTGYHHGGAHHTRSTSSGNRRGGGGGNGGPNQAQFHPSQQQQQQQQQQHLPGNPHLKQTIPPTSVGQHGSAGYSGLVQASIDQSATTGPSGDTFHQDGGFNLSRAAGPPPNYVGIDAFIPSHGGGPHPIHGGLYGRQDGQHPAQQHHHHHHQQQRGGAGPGGGSGGGGGGHLGGTGGGGNPNHHHHHQHHHHNSFPSTGPANALMTGPSNMAPQGTVMMVYGLNPERLNCDRLFNLFCLYGNVVRVKFLRTKEGCAMVQMGDVLAVDRCVSSLNKITLFGNELQLSYSKQAFLHDVIQPFILPDGSPSFKDFMGNKNNRFKNPEVASKNRILPPSQVLHFFNAPLGITEDELVHLFKQNAGHEPVSLKIFTPKVENTKSYSGLVTFRDPPEATEALVLCNHLSTPKSGAPHPYILRLCFSPPSYPQRNQQQTQQQQQPPSQQQQQQQLSPSQQPPQGAQNYVAGPVV